jgi:hypothetical protein
MKQAGTTGVSARQPASEIGGLRQFCAGSVLAVLFLLAWSKIATNKEDTCALASGYFICMSSALLRGPAPALVMRPN